MKNKQNEPTNNINEYLKTKVMTASPEQLQMMLYDGAIRFCEQARIAIQEKKIEQSYNLIVKAEKILLELCTSMREEIAPETCARMGALYMFCYDRLITANLKKDFQALDEALDIMRHMRQTWSLLMEKLQQEKTNNPSEPTQTVPSLPDALAEEIGATVSFEG